jgi:hypothetical protein
MLRTLAVLIAVLATAGYAAGTIAKDVPPFEYRYQVASVTLSATFTKGDGKATTELRLSPLPKRKSLDWYGPRSPFGSNGVSVAILHMVGTAAYTGLEAACNGTVKLDSSRWRQPIYGGVSLAYGTSTVYAKLSLSAGRFPVATVYRRRNGSCELGVLGWWQPGAIGYRPLSLVHQAGFSIESHKKESFDDGSTLDWTATAAIRTVHYKLIDCNHTPWC